MELYYNIGRYFLLIGRLFRAPERWRIFRRQYAFELDKIGTQSLGLVGLLSMFMGAVITLQTAANITSPLIPTSLIGFTTRQTTILEFSPTILSLILAGKVGSNVASEIGTMRISEQIDALDVMGINSAGYLIQPKLLAALTVFPFLIIISMFLSIGAGAFVGQATGVVSFSDYQLGIQDDFVQGQVIYALVKTLIFAFLIISISAYHGYYTTGGAKGLGEASTKGVVYSSAAIIVTNYLVTQLFL